MAYNNVQPQFVTAQPNDQVLVNANPFKQLCNDWSVGVCDCCDDVGQCE
jgi:hypothetical protein